MDQEQINSEFGAVLDRLSIDDQRAIIRYIVTIGPEAVDGRVLDWLLANEQLIRKGTRRVKENSGP